VTEKRKTDDSVYAYLIATCDTNVGIWASSDPLPSPVTQILPMHSAADMASADEIIRILQCCSQKGPVHSVFVAVIRGLLTHNRKMTRTHERVFYQNHSRVVLIIKYRSVCLKWKFQQVGKREG
jgi:hypothetical protein